MFRPDGRFKRKTFRPDKFGFRLTKRPDGQSVLTRQIVLIKTFDKLWQLLETFGNLWQLLATCDKKKLPQILPGLDLQCY